MVVPHFEKMLYDNALLARAYLHAYQARASRLRARVHRDARLGAARPAPEEGGFASALDADSEGEEGRFYVWTPDELRAALGEDALADAALAYFGMTGAPNFEGAGRPCAPRRTRSGSTRSRRGCASARERRVWPALDDKRLTPGTG